jgi:deoxyhypusine synthase
LFCPGISDSGIGLMMWGRKAKNHEKNSTNIDVFSDMNEIKIWTERPLKTSAKTKIKTTKKLTI